MNTDLFKKNNNHYEMSSEGVCAFDPISPIIKEVLLAYLRVRIYYLVKLSELSVDIYADVKEVINLLSLYVVNLDCESCEFAKILVNMQKEAVHAEKRYLKQCDDLQIPSQTINVFDKKKSFYISSELKFGEKLLLQKNINFSRNYRNLQSLILILAKNASVLLSQLSDYGCFMNDVSFETVKFLNLLNFPTISECKLKSKIKIFSKHIYSLVKRLDEEKIKKFGHKISQNVSFDINKGAAILVAGDNIFTLYKILDYFNDKDVSVYTYGDMIFAHLYPEIKKYSNLKGHYESVFDNIRFDFAKFPGVVVITQNSLDDTSFFIRGHIFSPDKVIGNGITKIENNDFDFLYSKVMKIKGFKEDIQNNNVNLKISIADLLNDVNKIIDKLKELNLKKISIIEPSISSGLFSECYKKIINFIGDESLVLVFNSQIQSKNVYNFDFIVDFSSIYKFVESLKNINSDIKIKFYFNECDARNIYKIFNLKEAGVDEIEITSNNSVFVNPSLLLTLSELFDIKYSTICQDDN